MEPSELGALSTDPHETDNEGADVGERYDALEASDEETTAVPGLDSSTVTIALLLTTEDSGDLDAERDSLDELVISETVRGTTDE